MAERLYPKDHQNMTFGGSLAGKPCHFHQMAMMVIFGTGKVATISFGLLTLLIIDLLGICLLVLEVGALHQKMNIVTEDFALAGFRSCFS
jgi:hypothetical protein